jgi:hypothetical protein
MRKNFLRGFLFTFFVVFVVSCSEKDYNSTNNGPATRSGTSGYYQYELEMIANVSKN